MQEGHLGRFHTHMAMDSHDVDAGGTQCFEYELKLIFVHREVAIDDGLLITADKSRPGVDPHRVADSMLAHLGGPAKRDLVDAIGHLTPHAENALYLLRIQ